MSIDAPDNDRPVPPAQATRDDEIHATNPTEFAELLALLQIRSGQSVARIATLANIPRSQAYALVKRDRTTLPRRMEQVTAFARACGLCAAQIGLVVGVWVRLAEHRTLPQQPTTADGVIASADQALTRLTGWRSWRAIATAGLVGVVAALLIMLLPTTGRVPAVIALVGIFVASIVVALCTLPLRLPAHRSRRRTQAPDTAQRTSTELPTVFGFIDDDID